MKWAVVAGVLFSIAVLMLSGPLASASSTVTFLPPYTGGQTYGHTWSDKVVVKGSCTGISNSSAGHASANLTNGHIRVAAMATFKASCGISSTAYFGRFSEVTVKSPVFTASSSGNYNISSAWVFDDTQTLNTTGAAVNQVSGTHGAVELTLLDVTTSKVVTVYSTHLFGLQYGNATKSVEKSPKSVAGAATFVAGDSYRLLATISIVVYIYIQHGSGSGTALFDMAFSGEHAVLSSITVS